MDAATAVELSSPPTPGRRPQRASDDGPAAPVDPAGHALLACVADPVRWNVLQHLAAGESCVCDIQARVPVAGNLLSYHLRVLREAGLILARRRGRWVDYRLAPDAHHRLAAALPVPAPPAYTTSGTTSGPVRP